MNRRTFGAGSLVRRLVIVGVLAAFCLVMFGPSVQAYSRDQVKTKMAVMPKYNDDPFDIDKSAPLKSARAISLLQRIRIMLGITPNPDTNKNGEKSNESATNSTTTR
jgi:hypothetical protein